MTTHTNRYDCTAPCYELVDAERWRRNLESLSAAIISVITHPEKSILSLEKSDKQDFHQRISSCIMGLSGCEYINALRSFRYSR